MKPRLFTKGSCDWTSWASVSLESMSPKRAAITRRRIAAVKLYLEGKSHTFIRATTGIDRKRLLKILKRCIAVNRDGRQNGFRGCLPYFRGKPYTRVAPSPALTMRTVSGHSGLFGAVLNRYPHISDEILKALDRSKGGAFKEPLLRIDKLHLLFLKLCGEAGIKRHEYPFNVETQGVRAFGRWLKKELALRDVRWLVSAAHGPEAAKRLMYLEDAVRRGAITRCLDCVEFDANRGDMLMIVAVDDPAGGEPVRLLLERIWILVVVDRASRAVLGYHVSLARNYSAEDVLICLENAILPWKPRKLRVRGLKYPLGSGLPSGLIPELAYACWAKLAFDNAKANCSHWVWDAASKNIGCVLTPGPVASPNTRPIVERLFRSLAQNGFQRLPTTTGRSLDDPRRRTPEKTAVQYEVTLEEMLDVIDVLIAQHNATPSEGLYGRSPLEYLQQAVDRKSFFIRQIPEAERADFGLTVIRTTATVRGSMAAGHSPYVQFLGVRYYSPKLTSSPLLIGKKLILECPSRDLRRVKVFLENGEEFDQLTAAQSWASQAHDLRVRKAILRCIRLGKIARRGVPDVIQAYIDYKTAESFKKRKSRNELAHALKLQTGPKKPPVVSLQQLPEASIDDLAATIPIPGRTLNF